MKERLRHQSALPTNFSNRSAFELQRTTADYSKATRASTIPMSHSPTRRSGRPAAVICDRTRAARSSPLHFLATIMQAGLRGGRAARGARSAKCLRSLWACRRKRPFLSSRATASLSTSPRALMGARPRVRTWARSRPGHEGYRVGTSRPATRFDA